MTELYEIAENRRPAVEFVRALGLNEKHIADAPMTIDFVGGETVVLGWAGRMTLTREQLAEALEGFPINRD